MQMLKILKFSIVLVIVVWSLSALNAQDRIVPYSQTPSAIKAYVSTHFPSVKVVQVEMEREGFSRKYEVQLGDGVKLEFGKKNKISGIDGTEKLPVSVIPEKITQYVNKNYPEYYITDWDLDNMNQKVELNSGIELKFTKDGKFLRIDD